MTFDRWRLLMDQFGFAENKETYNLLYSRYSEKHRAYHNKDHISDCLASLDSIPDFLPARKEIELALWFHDAIYNPYGKENELKSAQWATTFIRQQTGNEELEQIVFNLIMATLHSEKPSSSKEAMIMDIDISILGSDYSTYQTYSKNIRKEYKMVPGLVYRKKRKEILSNFLLKDKIYHTTYFSHLESAARRNLTSEIRQLS